MSQTKSTPFYDPEKPYEANLEEGPFGLFAEKSEFIEKNPPKHEVLGQKVNLPFGIPAGPLPNSKFVNAALDYGFDLVTYKTVRSRAKQCNPFPHVLPLDVEGDLTLEMAKHGVITKKNYEDPLTITNSFGVPSFLPDVWQPDLAIAVKHAKAGQCVIGSFQGTANGNAEEYIQDFALTARLCKEVGVQVFEINLSCPNEGTSDILCFDIPRVRAVTEAVKTVIGDLPLIIKIAYFADQSHLVTLVREVGGIVQAIAAINTIPAKIYADAERTTPALPGENRLVSGTCGDGVRWAGLEMTRRLKELKNELGLKYEIIGTGGVSSPEHYLQYREAGADAVMSATGAMWNPLLAQQIKQRVL